MGGAPLHKPHRYVPPQRVVFLHRFGLKTDVECAHFGLESGMGTRVNSKWILKNLFIKTCKVAFYDHLQDRKEVWRPSENGCGKSYFLVGNRVRIWRTGRHTLTKNSQEYPLRVFRVQH